MKSKLVGLLTLLTLAVIAFGTITQPTAENTFYVAGDEDIPIYVGR
ncbi:hypothetical protein [Fusibacter bizertensis]